MSKPLFVISSPFDTYSGYGACSRDLIKAIIETDKYDVKLYLFVTCFSMRILQYILGRFY